jgi:hypothetical protein
MAPTVNSDAVSVSASYSALDIACHDVRVFDTSSFTLGMAILIASVYCAASVEKIFGTVAVLSYFPLASAFVLYQHLVSLRIKRAEYAEATPARRRKIVEEVREYQEMMMAAGLIAPVTGVLRALRMQKSLGTPKAAS